MIGLNPSLCCSAFIFKRCHVMDFCTPQVKGHYFVNIQQGKSHSSMLPLMFCHFCDLCNCQPCLQFVTFFCCTQHTVLQPSWKSSVSWNHRQYSIRVGVNSILNSVNSASKPKLQYFSIFWNFSFCADPNPGSNTSTSSYCYYIVISVLSEIMSGYLCLKSKNI